MTDAPEEKKEAEAAKANGDAGPLRIPLVHKPVQANGEEIKELVFREPTGNDIINIGNPVNLDIAALQNGEKKITFDGKIMSTMMATLAGVPPSTIKMMHTKDWNNAAWLLSGFFTPDF
jgi:Phage tail assembly chaperone proteins, E, or 41 or 14